MNAASKGYLDIARYLLDYANPLIKNKFGETAYDVAAAAGEAYLCQVIEQYELKWHSLPFNSLDMHVTIPVVLVEEQKITKRGNTSGSIWYFKGDTVMNKSKVDLPNTSWFWLSDWTVDYTLPRIKNEDGWSYTIEKDENRWYTTTTTVNDHWIRRRQWIRIMKKVIDTTNHYDNSIITDNNNNNDLVVGNVHTTHMYHICTCIFNTFS